MDERSVVLLQIQLLEEGLCTLKKGLVDERINEDFRHRVKTSFSRAIKKQRRSLEDIKQQIEECDMPLEMAWNKFQQTYRDCRLLFGEYLSFIEGALSRAAHVDKGLCGIADGLLDELSDNCGIPWGQFTILAEGEFFHDLAGIIRVGFPEVTIWNLPVAVHEFGHFVAQELQLRKPGGERDYPFRQMLKDEAKGEPETSYLHEYFADLFATYGLGPAYAYTCIYLRFNPSMGDGDQHPSAAKRVYLILKTLELMGKRGSASVYLGVMDQLNKNWHNSLTAVGQAVNLDAPTVKQLDTWQARMYVMLEDNLPDSAKYEGWERAQSLATKFQATRESDALADVLNAAWLRRLNQWDEPPAISDSALLLCQEIIGKRRERELERRAQGR